MSLTRLGGGVYGDVHQGRYHGVGVAITKMGLVAADVSSIEKQRHLLGSIKPHMNVLHLLGMCVDAEDGTLRMVTEMCPFGASFATHTPFPRCTRVVLRQYMHFN